MTPRRTRSVLRYFLLTIALTLPFYLLDIVLHAEILPGLPLSAFSFACPAIAASILSCREGGRGEVVSLLKRSFDFGRIKAKAWYLPIFLLMPAIMALSYGIMRLAGQPLPAPRLQPAVMLGLLAAFFIGALGEELGWTGYATDPLQRRFGPLGAAALLGVVWAAWHYISLIEVHRSLLWIAWWTVGTLATRITIVWLYNKTGGSVFAAAAYHAMVNLTWQLFPVSGSFYDPQVTSPIMVFAALLCLRTPGGWAGTRSRSRPRPRAG